MAERVNELIEEAGGEIATAGWLPRGDWTNTPFEPIYAKAAREDFGRSAMFFGQLVRYARDAPAGPLGVRSLPSRGPGIGSRGPTSESAADRQSPAPFLSYFRVTSDALSSLVWREWT